MSRYPFYKTFANISTQEDFWAYVEEVIPRYLYPDEWYNGEPYGPDERRTILYTNRLVQAPRLRQIRRSLRNCSSIPPRLANFPLECEPSAQPPRARTSPRWHNKIKTQNIMDYYTLR